MFVLPTYVCNGQCHYCYARGYQHMFPVEMSLWKFIRAAEAYKKHGDNLQINILGGEPTLWKNLNLAIRYCNFRKIRSILFTNGLGVAKVMPTTVYLNITHYFEGNKKERMIKSLEYYQEKKVQLILRYNMEEEENGDRIDTIIELAKRFNATAIHIAPATPHEINRETGDKIMKVLRKIYDAGIRGDAPDPMAPCMFSDEDLAWLRKNTKYISSCNVLGVPFVNPDGKTLQPCLRLFTFKKMEKIGSPEEIKDLFRAEVELRKQKLPLEECHDCDYYKRGECVGECFAFRN